MKFSFNNIRYFSVSKTLIAVAILMSLSILVFSACDESVPNGDIDNTFRTENSIANENNPPISNESTHTENNGANQPLQRDLTDLTQLLSDGIYGIRYADSETLILTTTRNSENSAGAGFGFGSSSNNEFSLILANASTMEVENRTNYFSGYDSFGTPIVFSDKIMVAAANLDSEATDVLVFDRALNLVQTINISRSWSGFASHISFSADGGRIILCDIYGSIIAVDLTTQVSTTIFDISSTELLSINFVAFANNDSQIAFNGTIPDANGDGLPVYGLITLRDNSMVYFRNDNIDSIPQVTERFAFWDEKSLAFGETSSGSSQMIDFDNGASRSFTYVHRNESQNAHISGDGKNIVTHLLDFSTQTTTVRVYDVDSEALRNEFTLNGTVNFVAFSNCNSRFALITFDSGGDIKIFEYNL
jgi:hypothetical protein